MILILIEGSKVTLQCITIQACGRSTDPTRSERFEKLLRYRVLALHVELGSRKVCS